MARRLEDVMEVGPALTLRYWALFDSDALRPNKPSGQSMTLKAKCGSALMPHHQLCRRSIESYIPLAVLQGWAYSGYNRSERLRRSEIFQAFSRMSELQRHHYNLKSGFDGDARRQGPGAGDLYSTVSAVDKRALASGFGASIAELFSTKGVTEEHLRHDGGWDELHPIFNYLVTLVR